MVVETCEMEPEAFIMFILNQKQKSCFPGGYFAIPSVGTTRIQFYSKWGLLEIVPKAKA